MSRQYPISRAHVQWVHHQILYCPCQISTPVLPIYSPNTIFPDQILLATMYIVHSLSCPCPVRIPPLQPIIQSEYDPSCPYPGWIPLSCSCPVSSPSLLSKLSILSLLPVSSQNTTFPAPCPVRILPLLPMSSQNTTDLAHVQSVHHLHCPCPVWIPFLLPMSC